jgi:integration host factor subunit beta
MSGRTVTKADITAAIYEKTGLNRRDVRLCIDSFCEEVKNALCRQNSVELRGFGTFEVRLRRGRKKARNPRTGEISTVNAHGAAVFRPGRELKQSVWNVPGLDNTEQDEKSSP